MLTLDMLFAVFQGLPASHLTQLTQPWQLFCSRIQFALYRMNDPLAALKLALQNATAAEIRLLSRAIGEVQIVMDIPDLSARQKQALIALRYARVSTLSQLYKVLNWDRSNTFRCLAALMKKGYVGKFYAVEGPSYFAIERKLENSTKSAAYKLILDYLETFRAADFPPGLIPAGKKMTTSTTPTTVTTPIILTTPQVLPADPELIDSRVQPVLADSG